MGGCRCYFRGCSSTSSNNPGNHFFNFHRLNKSDWMKLAGLEKEIEKWTERVARNRSVCARHFEDDCFMNYTKSKLNNKPLPTLTKLTNEIAINYKNILHGDLPELIVLKPSEKPHMVKPSDYQCATDLNENEVAQGMQILKNLLIENKNIKNCLDRDTLEGLLKEFQFSESHRTIDKELEERSENVVITKRLKMDKGINSNESNIASTSHANDVEKDVDEAESAFSIESSSTTDLEDTDLETIYKNKLMQQEQTHLAIKAAYEDQLQDLTNHIKDVALKHQDEIDEQIQINVNLKCENDGLSLKLQEFKQKNMELQKTINILKTQHPSATTTKVIAEASNSSSIVVSNTNPNKAQLFNSIKWYLSPAMTALLRMEMFGHSDRTWKPDEQRVAVDIMQLGDSVYRYFTDEWRLRLPTAIETSSWIQQYNAKDVDDDI